MSRSTSRWYKWFLLLVLLLGGAAYGTWYYRQRSLEDLPQYQTTTVTRGELLQVVTASGQLNPVTMVDVGSQISGIIQQLLADFNSTVTQRQVIARIDPATYEANAIQAEGNLANARAGLELAQLEEQRAKALRSDKLNTQADYDNTVATLHQAEANVKMKEGALKSAQVDLARCTIYSPVDGLVLSRNVNVGQTVAASLSAPTLFVIANDLTKMQIEASVAEADIGMVEPGQPADFTVDAYPGRIFHGKVKQIRNAPKTDQNVVTYATIIEVSNPDLKLKPGMTANVAIVVARRDDALQIANAAFRFHPSERVESKKTGSQTKSHSKKHDGESTSGRKKEGHKVERVVYLWACQPATTNAPSNVQTGSLQATSIKTGINNAGFTEVLEGLKEGDEVVTGVVSSKGRPPPSLNPFASSSKR